MVARNRCQALNPRKPTRVLEVSPTMEIKAQLAAINKRMELMESKNQGQGMGPICGLCRGEHFNDQCPQIQENCNFVNNFQRQNQQWRGNWNQGQWGNQGVPSSSNAQQRPPPGFGNQGAPQVERKQG